MTRIVRFAIIGLALSSALAATESSARVSYELPLGGRIEAPRARAVAPAAAALAYAAPAAPALIEAERATAPAASEGAAAPSPRKTCPNRSWPNLAPRCVADLAGARS